MNKSPTQVFSYEYCNIFRSCFLYRATLVAASGEVGKTVKPDEMTLFMKIDCLNPASVNGAMLNLNKNWIDLSSMLHYSNDKIMICFWQQSLKNP